MNQEDETRAINEIRRVLGLDGAIHLDRDGLLVVGLSEEESGNLDQRLLIETLRARPDLPEAERCRKTLFGRMTSRLSELNRPGLTIPVYEVEKILDTTWVESRTDARAAARFPDALRALQRTWRVAMKPETQPTENGGTDVVGGR